MVSVHAKVLFFLLKMNYQVEFISEFLGTNYKDHCPRVFINTLTLIASKIEIGLAIIDQNRVEYEKSLSCLDELIKITKNSRTVHYLTFEVFPKNLKEYYIDKNFEIIFSEIKVKNNTYGMFLDTINYDGGLRSKYAIFSQFFVDYAEQLRALGASYCHKVFWALFDWLKNKYSENQVYLGCPSDNLQKFVGKFQQLKQLVNLHGVNVQSKQSKEFLNLVVDQIKDKINSTANSIDITSLFDQLIKGLDGLIKDLESSSAKGINQVDISKYGREKIKQIMELPITK